MSAKEVAEKKISLEVLSQTGEQMGEVEVSSALFGAEVKPHLLYAAMEAYLANQRQGNASTKTRSEVAGSRIKLFRQKGTGKARAGSRRSPTRVHGGIAFGPSPRDYRQRVPKKVRRQALRGALSSRAAAGEISVLDSLSLEEISTRAVAGLLDALKVESEVLLVVDKADDALMKSARNLPQLTLARAEDLNALEVMRHGRLVFTREGLSRLQEVMA
jgi:large subunit ribosomal protein L4